MGGNIGTPILDLPPPDESIVHVIEVSSFQIGDDFSCTVTIHRVAGGAP